MHDLLMPQRWQQHCLEQADCMLWVQVLAGKCTRQYLPERTVSCDRVRACVLPLRHAAERSGPLVLRLTLQQLVVLSPCQQGMTICIVVGLQQEIQEYASSCVCFFRVQLDPASSRSQLHSKWTSCTDSCLQPAACAAGLQHQPGKSQPDSACARGRHRALLGLSAAGACLSTAACKPGHLYRGNVCLAQICYA